MNSAEDPTSGPAIEPMLAAARLGSTEELGEVLQMARQYLLAVANRELESQLQGKAGASDLVQETFLQAQRRFQDFQGRSAEELLAWLRGILLHKMSELDRRYRRTGKRRIDREQSLESGLAEGAAPKAFAAEQTSPSGVAVRDEEAARLVRAIESLPEHYRQVIVWREWDGLSLDEIARRLKRTKVAARMVWARAIERLYQELEHVEEAC